MSSNDFIIGCQVFVLLDDLYIFLFVLAIFLVKFGINFCLFLTFFWAFLQLNLQNGHILN